MIVSRLAARLKFFLERLLQRGIWHQVLVMAALIIFVAVLGGVTVWAFGDEFESLGAAIWWSFLRLTDPGYLGDDEGALMRTVSTVVTVLGYVLFMGSLIAIMTQWLARTMRQLESGTTPIAINGHILILGWTNRTPEIIEQVVSSRGRLKRFLRKQGSSSLKIVVLAESVTLELTQQLRERIGHHLADANVIFRSGSSLKVEHLRRVDLSHSAAVIVPGADFEIGGWELGDTRVIKTLISITRFIAQSEKEVQPSIVAELFDSAKIPIARSTMSADLEIIASGSVIGGMIAQTVRNPGLSRVYDHLFSRNEPDSMYLRACPEFAGRSLFEVLPAFQEATPIGVVRIDKGGRTSLLNVSGMTIQESDLIIFVARDFEACVPARSPLFLDARHSLPAHVPEGKAHKILILGWSHKIFSLVSEFDGYKAESFEIDIFSRVSENARLRAFDEIKFDDKRIAISHLVGDYTVTSTIEKLNLHAYESIVFMASDNMDTAEQADARTVLAYVLTKDLLRGSQSGPQLLLELMDGENAHLFEDDSAETIISPRVLSHLLAQIAMRRELAVVYNELFGPTGADIVFRRPSDYEMTSEMSYSALLELGAQRGDIVLGIAEHGFMSGAGRLRFSITSDTMTAVSENDQIIVLTPATQTPC